jgi:hypothetical protein
MDQRPGETVWEAMARELASNPDSPASLKIMSAVGQAMAPRSRAVDQVVEALEAQLLSDGEQERAAVRAAIEHWERECGCQMESSLLEDLKNSARDAIEHRRRQPPSLDSILVGSPYATDTGYRLGIHLEGLEGTWHRLWAMICLSFGFGHDIETNEGVAAVRAQFEQLLGRAMSVQEWDALVAHARNHHETVMKPALGGSVDDES